MKLFRHLQYVALPLFLLSSHYVKSVRIRSYPGPHFPAFGLNIEKNLRVSPYSNRMREITDQSNSEYGHFLRSDHFYNSLTKKHILIDLF